MIEAERNLDESENKNEHPLINVMNRVFSQDEYQIANALKPAIDKLNRYVDDKTSMESENEMQSDNLSLPYPTDVTEQMLECFHDGFTLQSKRKAGLDLSPISEIAEELWIYSKLIKILVEPEDSDYLRTSLESLQKNIFERLQSLAERLLPEDMQQLSTLCESVFTGTSFEDNSFNVLVESLALSAKSHG